MVRILYGVSPIGLGHATRAWAVAQELELAGAEVKFASGGSAAEYLRSMGCDVSDVVSEPVPKVVDGEMKGVALWYLRYWAGFRRTRKKLERMIENEKPDIVVGDEEFSSVSVALETGLTHALVTDELELGFAKGWLARQIEGRVSRSYSEFQRKVSLLIIPEEGRDEGNRRYVGAIVRKATKTRDQTLHELGLPPGRMILVSMSGSGIGEHLLREAISVVREAGDPSIFLVVAGNRGPKVGGGSVFDLGFVNENQNLVAAADLVIAPAGKSTIDEARTFGTPIIPIPIRNHAEQERNALALGFGAEDIGRLAELVASKIGKREAPFDSRGAQNASRLILSSI